jgi:Mor family transcriptional regulator
MKQNNYQNLDRSVIEDILYQLFMGNTCGELGKKYKLPTNIVNTIGRGKTHGKIYNELTEDQKLIIKNNITKNFSNLSDQDVKNILNHLWEGKLTRTELAKMYNISEGTVHHLISGFSRKNIYNLLTEEQKIKIKNNYSLDSAILSPEDVIQIRELYQINKISCQELAKQFGVCRLTISRIIERKAWTHI